MSKTIAIQDGMFYFTPSGQLLEIEDSLKGEQDFVEMYLTEYIPEEDYGNELFSLVGSGAGVLVSGGIDHALEAISSQKIKDVVSRLQALQQDDVYSTEDERIGGITRLLVQTDPNSPSAILSFVELITESGDIVLSDTHFSVSIAQANAPKTPDIGVLLAMTPTPSKG
jgi:hypothetical protein